MPVETLPLPGTETSEVPGTADRWVGQPEWHVVVFNNEVNTFDEVILILQRATGCSLQEAELETWEIHHLGRSLVHYGSREECERAAAIIRTIGIEVAVQEGT